MGRAGMGGLKTGQHGAMAGEVPEGKRGRLQIPEKHCSRFNRGMLFWKKTEEGKTIIDPGEITAWVFINEFGGGRPHAYGESKEMVYF